MNISTSTHRLEFVRIHQVRLSNTYSWEEHTNDDIELTYVKQGVFHGFVDEQEYSAANGCLYFVQPGQKHWEEVATEKLDYICLRFKLWDTNNNSVGFINVAPQKPPCLLVPGKTNQILTQMLKISWYNDNPEEIFVPLIQKIIEQIEDEYKNRTQKEQQNIADYRNRIEPALLLIDSNLSKSFSISELAEVCYISPHHFSHLFKKVMGLPPLKYTNKKRIDVAKKMLTDKSLKIHVIATSLGFEDQFYFSRLFKKFTGLSPKDFRAYIHHSTDTVL